MLNRRTIWLLAVVMTLGCAYIVPGTYTDRGAEVCAIAYRAEHCEQQQIAHKPQVSVEAEPAAILVHAQPLRAQRFEWPASYQRPPTRNL